ncbi:MAG: hypothetical protein AMJ88_00715 [Anaerolineae bacterium SM23_ 63]|nr:MAG: hypothetical protein AMJ88_00715 [Anaerolineae bacterium SM23_ 63]HEY45748.1 hypothetical protein [Anaerolineae bacterium]
MVRSKVTTQDKLGITTVLILLLLATIACQIHLGGPKAPGEPIPTHPATSEDLTEVWQAAISGALTTGQVMVILDEVQLTTFIAHRLETDETPLLRQPQVYLRENAIQVFGTTERDFLKANVLLAITPLVDPDGNITLELTTAEFGPIPAPNALKETISAVLTEAFTGSFGSLATGIRVSTLAINEGQLAIVGELR